MEDQNDGFAEDDNIAEDLERAFADEPIHQDDDDDDDDESTQEEDEALDDFRDNPMAAAYSSESPAEGWANLTTRVFYSKLLLHRSVNRHSLYEFSD